MVAKSSMNSSWKLLLLGVLGGLFLLIFLDKIKQNPLVKLSDQPNLMTKPIEKLKLNISSCVEELTKETNRACNIFDGRWIYKEDEKSSYNALTCPFLDKEVSCQRNGRPDIEYEKWIWEANNCYLPLFDGRNMLERLRNKRVIIVGDSINRNMWESLACLLYNSIPSSRAQVIVEDSAYKVFKAKDYNVSVEFHWSPLLAELNKNHKSGRRVLILDKLSSNSEKWLGADIMVFNSAHWWAHTKTIRTWDLFEYKGNLTIEIPVELAFKHTLQTWSSWIKKNVDLKKTMVFFRGFSPQHNSHHYNQWCYNVTRPRMDDTYVMNFPRGLLDVIEKSMQRMSKYQVKYLNITKLSEYRIDAHPSIYKNEHPTIHFNKFQDNLSRNADCSHWCLPGLPDTWNKLLYASIFFDTLVKPIL